MYIHPDNIIIILPRGWICKGSSSTWGPGFREALRMGMLGNECFFYLMMETPCFCLLSSARSTCSGPTCNQKRNIDSILTTVLILTSSKPMSVFSLTPSMQHERCKDGSKIRVFMLKFWFFPVTTDNLFNITKSLFFHL